jgi:hypothetical protein
MLYISAPGAQTEILLAKAIDDASRDSYTPGMGASHNQQQDSAWAGLLNMTARCGKDFDRFLSDWHDAYTLAGGRVFCHCGCSGCCSLVVNCSFPEALRAATALSDAQRERLQRYIQVISTLAHDAATLPEWLRAHRTQSGGCPFLTVAGTCGIYAERPASCRALLATREPNWCTADFSALSSGEKQAFMASLDRSIVAFPLHYVAVARERGEELEHSLLQAMTDRYGFALYGNLPVLVWLEQEFGLSDAVSAGRVATERLLAEARFNSPLLVTMIG